MLDTLEILDELRLDFEQMQAERLAEALSEKRVEAFERVVGGEIFPVLVTHMISEADAEEFAKEKGIALYYSYDF